MCNSNIQRPLASERPVCPVLLTNNRLGTQFGLHQACLSANSKCPKGTFGRALHHGLQYKTLLNEGIFCTQKRATLSLIWLVNRSCQGSSSSRMTSNNKNKSVQYV